MSKPELVIDPFYERGVVEDHLSEAHDMLDKLFNGEPEIPDIISVAALIQREVHHQEYRNHWFERKEPPH